MRKLLLFILLFPSIVFSAIDECKTDIYFANGILTDEKSAVANTDLLRLTIISETYGGDMAKFNQHIGKVDDAYNSTHGNQWDLLESALQKFDWVGLTDIFGSSHGADLDEQIKKYQESITDGHKVFVVAHSQGNLFTREAYIALGEESANGWMQKYFEAISIASPMSDEIKEATPRIDWDNDIVPRIATFGAELPWMMPCNVRKS